MNELQIDAKRPKKQIVFVPPESGEIDKYALEVCQRLDNRLSLYPYNTELVHGFAGFMKTIIRIQSKSLNKGATDASETQ